VVELNKPEDGYEAELYKRPLDKSSGAMMTRGTIKYKNVSKEVYMESMA
jgi:hypothetical protein